MLWYMASPYAAHPRGFNQAFIIASRVAYDLTINRGLLVYSPVAHFHPIFTYGGTAPHDANYDKVRDLMEGFMNKCDGIIVVKAEGWEKSYGMSKEIEYMVDIQGKPRMNVPVQIGVKDAHKESEGHRGEHESSATLDPEHGDDDAGPRPEGRSR